MTAVGVAKFDMRRRDARAREVSAECDVAASGRARVECTRGVGRSAPEKPSPPAARTKVRWHKVVVPVGLGGPGKLDCMAGKCKVQMK